MKSFKHHLLSAKELNALRITRIPKPLAARISEGITRFEVGLSDLYLADPPLNSSKRTKYELEELAKHGNRNHNPNLIELKVSHLLSALFDEHSVHLPAPSYKRMNTVLREVRTACTTLQYQYGRIRPRVLAAHYGITLPDTYKHHDATPSYPSTRSTQMAFLELYLGERLPKLEPHLHTLSQDTDRSLLCSALHYRSDIEASHELARYLFTALKRKL